MQAAARFPGFSVIATTLRAVMTATVNGWSAIAWPRADGALAMTTAGDTAAAGKDEIDKLVADGGARAAR